MKFAIVLFFLVAATVQAVADLTIHVTNASPQNFVIVSTMGYQNCGTVGPLESKDLEVPDAYQLDLYDPDFALLGNSAWDASTDTFLVVGGGLYDYGLRYQSTVEKKDEIPTEYVWKAVTYGLAFVITPMVLVFTLLLARKGVTAAEGGAS